MSVDRTLHHFPLDPASRQSFYDIIRDLRDRGVTVLLSSHALSEIEGRTDRIAVMSHGRLVAFATLAELRDLAALPVRIRVQLSEGAPRRPALSISSLSCERLDATHLEFTCANSEKMEVVRQVSETAAVADMEIVPPTLDDIYAQLMRSAAE